MGSSAESLSMLLKAACERFWANGIQDCRAGLEQPPQQKLLSQAFPGLHQHLQLGWSSGPQLLRTCRGGACHVRPAHPCARCACRSASAVLPCWPPDHTTTSSRRGRLAGMLSGGERGSGSWRLPCSNEASHEECTEWHMAKSIGYYTSSRVEVSNKVCNALLCCKHQKYVRYMCWIATRLPLPTAALGCACMCKQSTAVHKPRGECSSHSGTPQQVWVWGDMVLHKATPRQIEPTLC